MSKKDLLKYIEKDESGSPVLDNIAELLTEDELGTIGKKVLSGYREDFLSMQEWLDNVETAIKLAALVKEPKNTPFPNAANIKFPLITNACLQFAANIYPEIIKDGKVVKATVLGKDNDNAKANKARNVSDYMSYQLLFQSTEWEEGLDKLLNLLPDIGFLVKKSYYDPIKERNCSDVCFYKDIVINEDALNLKDAPRITHVLHLRLNDLVSHSRSGLYLEKSVTEIYEVHKDSEDDKHIDCLEQHRSLDLDNDGFEEPYIVTVEKETGKVLRIYPRYEKEEDIKENKKGEVKYIKACHYFTAFHFIPNPNGKFLSIGFGTLMLHINETINTIVNQLIDAGTLANMQGGYIDSRMKLNSGASRHTPGEWVRVKPVAGQILKDGFMPIIYKEPSSVLYALLGFLVQAGKELSSSTEAMQGSVIPDNAKTGAVANLIDRGLKVFNAIQRRVYRSLKDEYQKLFELNAKYMNEEEYMTVLDDTKAVYRADFDIKSVDVMPVADPNLSSDTQRIGQIQILQSLKSNPGADIREIDMRTLQFARIQEPEKILPLPPENTPPPPEVIKLQAEMATKQEEMRQANVKLQQEQQRIDMDKELQIKTMAKIDSEIMKNLAQAEAADQSTNLKDLDMTMRMLQTKIENVMEHKQMDQAKELEEKKLEVQNAKQQGTPTSMAPAPDDATVSGDPSGTPPSV